MRRQLPRLVDIREVLDVVGDEVVAGGGADRLHGRRVGGHHHDHERARRPAACATICFAQLVAGQQHAATDPPGRERAPRARVGEDDLMPRPFDREVEDQRIRVMEHGVVRLRRQHGLVVHGDQLAQRGRIRLVAGRIGGAVEQVEQGLARGALPSNTFRHVAPVLAQRIGHQRVLRHAQAERVAVQRLAGVARHVPVVGDLVVVEDHVARDVGQHPAHVLEVLAEQRELRCASRSMPKSVALLGALPNQWLQRDRIAAEDHARGLRRHR